MKRVKFLTFVPSNRQKAVEEFSYALAKECGVTCLPLIEKKGNTQQKAMENTSYQCKNALNSYEIVGDIPVGECIILIDDLVDSKWTMTVCGYKLIEKGINEVMPFALADSSHKGDEDEY